MEQHLKFNLPVDIKQHVVLLEHDPPSGQGMVCCSPLLGIIGLRWIGGLTRGWFTSVVTVWSLGMNTPEKKLVYVAIINRILLANM